MRSRPGIRTTSTARSRWSAPPMAAHSLRLISKINGQWVAEKFGNDKAEPIEPISARRYLGTLARAAEA